MTKIKLLTVLVGLAMVGVGVHLALSQKAAADETGPMGFGGKGHPGIRRGWDGKAEVLGMTPEELREALANQTFGDLLEQQGLSQEDLHAQMEAKMRTRLEERGLSVEEIEDQLARRQQHRYCLQSCLGEPAE